ncbi:MAG: aminotransferase class I/II-fold pyridoxal phosphate-dependent enzyme [Crenarchaeota archaeon]|nr:aminotransferase class I/II-fold pyridoxal phosphate-dependent enzyme [Thermoproteota archaeon]
MNRSVTQRRVIPIHYIFEHGGTYRGESVIDLSSNINPLGAPNMVRNALENLTSTQLQRFPDRENIISNLSAIENIDSELLYPVPGASTGIVLTLLYTRPRECTIQDISYLDYIRICSKLDINIIKVPTIATDNNILTMDVEKMCNVAERMRENSMIVIVCPNNPTGCLIEYDDIRRIVETARCNVLIDLTFIDFLNLHDKYIKLLDYDNVIIIKSLTKILGAPGLRIGYIAGRLVKSLPGLSWPLGIVSELVLERIADNLKEYRRFILSTSEYVHAESRRVIRTLLGNLRRIRIYDTHTHMFTIEASDYLHTFLLEKYNIKIRKFCILDNGRTLHRVSIRDRKIDDVFIEALKTFEEHE